MTEGLTPAQARAALDHAAAAQRRVAEEVGLPGGYWWAMAGGWIVLGVIGALAPWFVTVAATVLFGAGHAALASRLLDGRRRTQGVRVSSAVAGRRTPVLVVALLVLFVLLTIGVALLLEADGAEHPSVAAAVLVAVVVALAGDRLLRLALRWTRR